MAIQKRKNQGVGARFMQWARENQKVLFVLLLAATAVGWAFGTQISTVLQYGGEPLALGFGRSISQEDYNAEEELLRKVARLAPHPGASVQEFLLYKGVARDLGLRVSDEELGARVRQLWRARKAMKTAEEKIAGTTAQFDDPRMRQYLNSMISQKFTEVFDVLEKEDVFDADDYAALVAKETGGLRVSVFERVYRDVLLVQRLFDHVTSTRHVTPQEIYEEYVKKEHRRGLRWLEVNVPDEVRANVKAAVSDGEVRKYYEDHRNETVQDFMSRGGQRRRFEVTEPRVRFRWLRADRDAFVEEVEKEVTDEKLREFYENERGRYVTPGLFADAAAFVLRTPEEKAAREQASYRPFEEVKDEVRRRFVKRTSGDRLRDFAFKLRTRLYPDTVDPAVKEPAKSPAISFEALAKEYASLATGLTPFATGSEAEKAFGDLYTGDASQRIKRWLDDARTNRSYALKDADLKTLRNAIVVTDASDEEDGDLRAPRFFVFLTDVELKRPGTKTLDEAREEIVQALAHEKLNERVEKALEKEVEALKSGAKKLPELAKASIEIELDGGEKVAVTIGDLEDTGSAYVQSKDAFGSVMVPKKKDRKDAKAGEAEEGDDPSEVEEERHKSSDVLRDALFALEKPGEVGTARDDKEGRFYLIEYTGRVDPDPADFAAKRRTIEQNLLSERRGAHFKSWREELYREAGLTYVPPADAG